MGLFDRFRKQNAEHPSVASPQSTLPSICYGIAYFILPHYAFKDSGKLIGMFKDAPATVGPFFYLMGCQVRKLEPAHEDAQSFRAHHGQLDSAYDYFVLEYPAPPPVDLSEIDPTQLPSAKLPVLAPHFSAVVRHSQTGAINYYTLGQAPIGGGTTFRSVTPEGVNCNLGLGPEPRLDTFLERLRSRG